MLVDLDKLMLFLSSKNHFIDIIGNPRPAGMTQHEHLRVIQNVQIHLSSLRKRCVLRKLVVMDARHQIVEVFCRELKKGLIALECAAYDIFRADDILAKKPAIKCEDIGLGTAQHHHAVPHARPDTLIDKELVVANMNRGRNHARKVIGRPQHLKATLARCRNVLGNR